MSLKLTQTSVVDSSGGHESVGLSSLFSLTTSGNPAYLVVDALDRNEYTAGASGQTGYFSGNGATLNLASTGGDGRGAGIVFTWQASSGQYVNTTYGALSQLAYTDSTSQNDVANISLFGTSNLGLAQAYAANAYALMQTDASGYLGSVTFATETGVSAAPPAQATPDGIAAAAAALVGQAWNNEGCWVLASTIAAQAGAGLPVQSTAIGLPGAANGEWITLYNGPAGASGNWQSLVSAGDMVVFGTSANRGHITTCVSGSGATAMLVDNITYIGQYGQITNSANDGSASDVVIAAPHPAAQEFAGVAARSVVIYALDTPAITDRLASENLRAGASVSLATLFAATDPAHKSITAYQLYNAAGSDSLLLNGHAVGASSASAPITAASLTTLSLLATATPAADTLEIRASNGSYWGDWQSFTVNAATTATKTVATTSDTVKSAALIASDWTADRIAQAQAARPASGTVKAFTISAMDLSMPDWLAGHHGMAPGHFF